MAAEEVTVLAVGTMATTIAQAISIGQQSPSAHARAHISGAVFTRVHMARLPSGHGLGLVRLLLKAPHSPSAEGRSRDARTFERRSPQNDPPTPHGAHAPHMRVRSLEPTRGRALARDCVRDSRRTDTALESDSQPFLAASPLQPTRARSRGTQGSAPRDLGN